MPTKNDENAKGKWKKKKEKKARPIHCVGTHNGNKKKQKKETTRHKWSAPNSNSVQRMWHNHKAYLIHFMFSKSIVIILIIFWTIRHLKLSANVSHQYHVYENDDNATGPTQYHPKPPSTTQYNQWQWPCYGTAYPFSGRTFPMMNTTSIGPRPRGMLLNVSRTYSVYSSML